MEDAETGLHVARTLRKLDLGMYEFIDAEHADEGRQGVNEQRWFRDVDSDFVWRAGGLTRWVRPTDIGLVARLGMR